MPVLSNRPVGSARARRPKDSKNPRDPECSRYCRAAETKSCGTAASRLAYSPSAGRKSKPGSNGSSAASLSMNIACISDAVMPFTSPAAMKLPELTPT